MKNIRFSLVIFYGDDGKILIQDRRNLGKDAIEWGWFGGGLELHETPIEGAIREIQEEINLTLVSADLTYIAAVTTEKFFKGEHREGHIFCVPWRDEFNKDFCVLEGAGFDWVTPDEMRERVIYPGQRYHLSIFEDYLKENA